MRRALAATFLTTWGAAWMACSSFEDAPMIDGPDGSTDATTISPIDATGDSTTAGDATNDATNDACAFFCDGFERTADLGNDWTELPPPRAAMLSLSNQHPKSGMGSMQLVLYGDSGAEGGRTAQIVKNLPANTDRAALDFWLFYAEPPSTDTTIANITMDGADGNIIVLLRSGGGFVLAEQYRVDGGPVFTDNDTNVGSIGNNKPRHLRLEVGTKLLGGNPGARLEIDQEAAELPLQNPNPNAHPQKAWFGSGYSQPGVGRNEDLIWFDDIVIEAP